MIGTAVDMPAKFQVAWINFSCFKTSEEFNPSAAEPEYSEQIWSVPCLLMTWHLVWTKHLQPWYWLLSLLTMQDQFTGPCHPQRFQLYCVLSQREKCRKGKYIYDYLNKSSTKSHKSKRHIIKRVLIKMRTIFLPNPNSLWWMTQNVVLLCKTEMQNAL